MTVAQRARADEQRNLADDLAMQDWLALAAHLAGLDAEVTLAPVGEPLTAQDLRSVTRSPGLLIGEADAIVSPREDASASAKGLAAAADAARAELLILHDPALAAARRDARPTVVYCERSRLANWRERHGEEPAPEPIRAAAALERLGLHAADRVIAPSRAMSSAIVALHGLTLPPAATPPVFRKPEAHEKRSGETGLILAGAASPDPRDVLTLDRAAAQVCGQTLLFDTGPADATGSLCLGEVHRLPGMSAACAEAMLLRAAAFYCPSSGLEFERLVWRAASAGCALILPDTPAHREFWQGAAHFVPARDEPALAGALRRMLEDEDYRRRTAAAALRRARALSAGPAIATLHKALAAALGASPLTAAL